MIPNSRKMDSRIADLQARLVMKAKMTKDSMIKKKKEWTILTKNF